MAEDGSFGCVGDGDSVQVDIFDGHFRQSVEEDGSSGAFAGDVVDVDVAEHGCLFAHGRHVVLSRSSSVEEVEEYGFSGDVYHVHLIYMYVFHDAATSACALEAESDVRAEEGAVVHEDVLHTAGHLAADDESSVSVQDGVVAHDDVLRRYAAFASFSFLPDLMQMASSPASKVELSTRTLVHDSMSRASPFCEYQGLETLILLTVRCSHIIGVQAPTGGVLECHAFEKHCPALGEAQEHGTEEVAYGFPSRVVVGIDDFTIGHIEVFCHGGPVECALAGIPHVALLVGHASGCQELLPLSFGEFAFLHRTPCVTVAVDGAVAGDGDVFRLYVYLL